MISNATEIKSSAIIVEVVGDFIKLKKKGPNYVACCPFHSEKTASFTISESKGIYKCFGCGRSGDSIAFLMEAKEMNYVQALHYIANKYNIEVDNSDPKKYEKPVPRLESIRPDTITYFESRGISNNTILRFKVTEATEWMPGADAEVRAICFNYFRDQELVNIKYRAKNRDFKMQKNSELIFYNLDNIKEETTCIIVEGEVDCMSMHEAGIYNVVSVPNGATKPSNEYTGDLKYLDNCWGYFDNKKSVIIMTDNDPAGNALREELSRRLGRDRCMKIEYPEGCKDANDVLVKHGKQMLHVMVETAKKWPIEGMLSTEDFYDEICDYYENGYPKAASAEIGEFDDYLTFGLGRLTIITGAPNEGKSEFVDWIVTKLARIHGWKFAMCSFENPIALHITKIMQKFVGKAFDFRKDPANRMDRTEFEHALIFSDDHFQFVNVLQVGASIENLLSKLREVVLKKGVKGIVIDPWNFLEHKITAGYTETQYISEALTLLKEFALLNMVHIFVIAHPKKMYKDPKTGEMPVATMYDIAGSAHFFNKADNGISVKRDFARSCVEIHIQKVRFEWEGKKGHTIFNYDTFKRQYTI